ncbi:MAG: hypothetical protein GX629_04660, partial [Phycisphaerae bacterium]|nr:hypothetical protein [Phycisphaerae bacterium]
MTDSPMKFNVGLVPLMADLYRRLIPDLNGRIEAFVRTVIGELSDSSLKIVSGPVSCTQGEIRQSVEALEKENIDLLVVAHTSYCASGQIAPVLLETSFPILLWPAQP